MAVGEAACHTGTFSRLGGSVFVRYAGSMKTSQESQRALPTVSHRFPDGTLIELVYDPEMKKTQLAVGGPREPDLHDTYALPDGTRLKPFSASNNLIKHQVLLLASRPEPYGTLADLVQRIDAYLHRYVDVGDAFRTLASYYILLTWVYDAFNELPYLRLRGDYGSGKTRALFVIGSLCHKAFFASGASTISPIFHMLDTFRGTLIFDEADFRFSDEKAELVKIFNNGNVRGFPVLRTAVTPKKEFEPRAFNVFGPKIVAMRRSYEDEALESRFFTEEMGRKALRTDIPISLPDSQRQEALALRNALLWYRFAMLPLLFAHEALVDPTVSPRLNQILVPLLSIIEDEQDREVIRHLVEGQDVVRQAPRRESLEGVLLQVLSECFESKEVLSVSVGALTARLIDRVGETENRPLTTRYVGYLLRARLGMETVRRQGKYLVFRSALDRLALPEERDPEIVDSDSEGAVSGLSSDEPVSQADAHSSGSVVPASASG